MKNDYWTTVTESKNLYQMGALSHRVYLLNLLTTFYNKTGLTIEPIQSLLDVGCGTGPIYQMLKYEWGKVDSKWNLITKYKGVDPSHGMIDVCKLHFPEGDWQVEDARHLDEPDNSWDCLLYMHSFDYLYDYEQAIKEMARVTKKYVCIVLWQALENGDAHRLNNSINGAEPVDWDTARLQHFSWIPLQKDFAKYGLKVLLKKDDKEINQEGKTNTLILLEKERWA